MSDPVCKSCGTTSSTKKWKKNPKTGEFMCGDCFEKTQEKLRQKKLLKQQKENEEKAKQGQSDQVSPQCYSCKAKESKGWKKNPKTGTYLCLDCFDKLKKKSTSTPSSPSVSKSTSTTSTTTSSSSSSSSSGDSKVTVTHSANLKHDKTSKRLQCSQCLTTEAKSFKKNARTNRCFVTCVSKNCRTHCWQNRKN
eukprot:TRINITY_DN4565_c0_g1_i2.p1 TRINITY_DN4565_c0_g1~~TRINITY_DN4565_c0_g1_i2.p1  ORF type:complete len:206 (-),score=50.80 TRINITY_DN4565_c0_g1_i2:26-607(-)